MSEIILPVNGSWPQLSWKKQNTEQDFSQYPLEHFPVILLSLSQAVHVDWVETESLQPVDNGRVLFTLSFAPSGM